MDNLEKVFWFIIGLQVVILGLFVYSENMDNPELKIPLEQPCDGPPAGFDIASKPDICETDMRET